MQVLDKGEIKLINFMGGDESVIAAARVSNGVSYEDASKGPEKDQKLITYLVKHRHGSPFEHATFQFFVKAPLFVVREWQRHRMASYNEVSGRYTEFRPEFYVPAFWRVPGDTNKQGSRVPLDTEKHDDWHVGRILDVLATYRVSYNTYESLLKMGVAKEMARMVLPLATYTQFYWTVNARSLSNFCSLRSAEDAQWEIRQYSEAIEQVWAEKMPMTYKAWMENGRISL